MDNVVNAGAVLYGLQLVLGSFIRHPLTEALRIDTLFMPQAGDKGRPINLILGLLIAGYGVFGLWKS
jgi:hypothetical protein